MCYNHIDQIIHMLHYDMKYIGEYEMPTDVIELDYDGNFRWDNLDNLKAQITNAIKKDVWKHV